MKQYIGGTVFYDAGPETGVEYTFYDKNGNVIDYEYSGAPGSISSLTIADSYIVTGTPHQDRFSAFAEPFETELEWGWYGNDPCVSADEKKHDGKQTTLELLRYNRSFCSDSSKHMTIWDYLKTANSLHYEGHSDWYVPSKAEMEALYESRTCDAMLRKMLWTSTVAREQPKARPLFRSWIWFPCERKFYHSTRDNAHHLLLIRSF